MALCEPCYFRQLQVEDEDILDVSSKESGEFYLTKKEVYDD